MISKVESGRKYPKVALLFPGQGSQFEKMGQQFLRFNSKYLDYFEKAEDVLKKDLQGIINGEDKENSLNDTRFSQVAIYCLSCALFDYLTKLSRGLKDYQKLGWTADESVQLTTVLTGVTGAFAAAGGEAATPTGLFGAVFGNAFSPNATKKGIDSVMGAGKALTSIVVGLTEFQKLVDSKVDFNVLGEAISKTVGFIQRAFAAVAEEGNVEAGGFFGSLFGIEKNKVAEGLASVQGAGKALKDIALGLGEFQKSDKKTLAGDQLRQ